MILDYKEMFAGEDMEYKSLPPVYNENVYGTSSGSPLSTRPFDYNKVMQYVKKSPEALGIVDAIATDIVSDGWHFDGKIKYVDKAKKFCKDNDVKGELKAAVVDTLITGNAGIWTGMSDSKLKEGLTKNGLEYKEFSDEDWSIAKKFKCVPWSTMEIELNSDGTEIAYFRQVKTNSSTSIVDTNGRPIAGKYQSTGISERRWEPEEIIHFKYLSIDGKAYGYSPMIALMPEISTIQSIKDYAGNFFTNSGIPDWMFIFPKEQVGSNNFNKAVQHIQQWQDSKNKRRNLAIAGEIEVQKLNEFNKDMEFRQLAVYYAATMAFAFNMPMGRMHQILGMEVKGQEPEIAGESYYRRISAFQDYIEGLLNNQLFEKYFGGVELHFNKSYLQDEIRESQNAMFKADYLMKLSTFLSNYDREPSEDYIKTIMGLDEGDMPKMSEEKIAKREMQQQQGYPGNRQNQQPNSVLTAKSPDYSAKKKVEQESSMESKKKKPSGY